jgi:hypothetical protein
MRPGQASTDEPAVPRADDLANLVALQTMFLTAGACLTMHGLDTFPVWAGIFVVIHLAVSGWIFR